MGIQIGTRTLHSFLFIYYIIIAYGEEDIEVRIRKLRDVYCQANLQVYSKNIKTYTIIQCIGATIDKRTWKRATETSITLEKNVAKALYKNRVFWKGQNILQEMSKNSIYHSVVDITVL